MLRKLQNYVTLAAAYFRMNVQAQIEYRGAFLSQVVAMFLNNCGWLAFWSFFFTRFPVLHGWNIQDVITIWALAAAGFGIAHSICGNALFLPAIIARGQLDVWMLYPRALLPHLILGRMSATACGDALFGYAAYILFVRPDAVHFVMFVFLTLSTALLFVGFSIASASLGFYLGNSEGLSEQWRFAMLTFCTYPATLFDGAAKLLLYTLVPAGFVSYLPVQALHSLSWSDALLTLLGSIAVLTSAVVLFYHGLNRYESGNLMEMRG